MRYQTQRTLGDLTGADRQHQAARNPEVRLQGLANGDAGVAQTLRIMRDFARQSIRSTDQTIRQLVLSVVANVAPRDWSGEVRACQLYVRDAVRYVQDPEDVELVQTPEKTLEYGQGDCDDKSTLLAAMLISIGHPARFAAVGMDGNEISHVLVQTKIADDWIWLETILPGVPMGWCPPNVTRAYFLKV